jgi:hypothetical protein
MGNELDNYLLGNSANNGLMGGDGNDILVGDNGTDFLIGGRGQDTYHLGETTPATDTLRIGRGDSLPGHNDTVTDFKLGTGAVNITGVDRLDLDSNRIAANAFAIDGHNSGNIRSHHISNGIISFDDVNHYNNPLTISNSNLNIVFSYLQDNITGNNTVAFISEGNTFVFQDGGTQDTLVELVGVTANSLSPSGIAAGSVWII